MGDWSFLTNHARALLCIAHDPGVRLRDIAGTRKPPAKKPSVREHVSAELEEEGVVVARVGVVGVVLRRGR